MNNKAYHCAIALLARREHGAQELAAKLLIKGYAETQILEAIAECQRLHLQSDERFAQAVCNARIRQGYGPLRIKQELKHKQINSELINDVLAQQDNWIAHGVAVWQKKCKDQWPLSYAALQKQQRFLLYRGFPTEIITLILESVANCYVAS